MTKRSTSHPNPSALASPIYRNVFFILPFLISAYFQGGVLSLELFRSLGVVLNTLLEVARCMPGARRMWVEQLGALSAL